MNEYGFVDLENSPWQPSDKNCTSSKKRMGLYFGHLLQQNVFPRIMEMLTHSVTMSSTINIIMYAGEPEEDLFLFTISLLNWKTKDLLLRIESRHN